MQIRSVKAIHQIRQHEPLVDGLIEPTHLLCDPEMPADTIRVEEVSRRLLDGQPDDGRLRVCIVTFRLVARAETFKRLGEVLLDELQRGEKQVNPGGMRVVGQPEPMAYIVKPTEHGFLIEDNPAAALFKYGIVLEIEEQPAA